MFWHSVVGKLWFTILLLVTVVLTILMVMLLRSLENFNLNKAETQLGNYADMAISIYNAHDEDTTTTLLNEYSETFDANIVIVEDGLKAWSAEGLQEWRLAPETFLEGALANDVLEEGERVVTEGSYQLLGGASEEAEIMIVGVPLGEGAPPSSGAFLYQPLSAVEETSSETRQIVYFSAGIALVLTTFFAFFLSSRVTAPLRKMRQAALEVAEGQFHTKVPILTYDEIGQLAIAFNRMRRELNRNITELNQEKEQLSHILVSMADGVITLDRKGNVVLTNPQAERFFVSWFYEQGSGSQVVPERLPEALHRMFEEVVDQEKEQLIEHTIQGRSWAILMAPLYEGETIRGAVAVIRDVTEERRHDKLRKDFIANVSHELRTPISMLQGYSEAMVDGVMESEEDHKEVAKIIYDESLRMGRLVNELLDIARMEAGFIELYQEELNLSDFASRIVRKFATYAKDYGVAVDLSGEKIEGTVVFDPDRIEQVLTNLMSNAIRHTEEGGQVTLDVRISEQSLIFSVIDTGTGIPEEDLPYVFERFYKADKARTRSRGGTGLGLAIAKNIVDAHKGELSVHSKIGEGTTFTFTLPRNLSVSDERDR
ncbi:ATP-binding protein [Shouchella shacheensis]|uniref:ATP-binding protein n=1 Tax=Shouchella shacheensis TaxID=1649580 RepID=UPI0007403BBD|nr:ATP-binding protein [Shouchella shacheensis]